MGTKLKIFHIMTCARETSKFGNVIRDIDKGGPGIQQGWLCEPGVFRK